MTEYEPNDTPDATQPAGVDSQSPDQSVSPKEPPFKYLHSGNLPSLLGHLGITVLSTTFQAGRVLSFSGYGGKCSLLVRAFQHPMGIALDGRRMALVCSNQVWYLSNQNDLRDAEGKAPPYDAYYVPRHCYVTGNVAGHEAAWGIPADAFASGAASDDRSELWLVNTRFSCLCTMSTDYSFIPRWQPPFITALAPEDRCHLNGVAMVDGRPTYVTCLAQTDTPHGWRDRKVDGGTILDVATGEVVSTGMAMPHSPRIYRGRMYVLDSGRAELQAVDIQSGRRETITRLPGFVRGLAFADRFAFIGLSRARESRTFGGLPIEEFLTELECGIQAVDLETGQIAAFIRFEQGCDELFDVQVAPGVSRLNVIGFTKETINGIFVLPKGAGAVHG